MWSANLENMKVKIWGSSTAISKCAQQVPQSQEARLKIVGLKKIN